MKKIIMLAIFVIVSLVFAACGSSPSGSSNGGAAASTGSGASASTPAAPSGNHKFLVIYYSKTNNTATVADKIHSRVGGDIVRVEPVTPYPDDYRQTTEQAKKEIAEGFKPPIKTQVPDLASYDVIFVGTPIWWGTFAGPMYTFLSDNNLAGKTLVPFVTHGGSGLGSVPADLAKLQPNATILSGLAIRGSNAGSSQGDVDQWLKGLGYIQ